MKCLQCDTLFEPKRKTAQFCSSYCRVKYNRSKAAEEGDPSVVWGEEKFPDAGILPTPKKPSTSHVVLLKQRVKERILGKAGGHSTNPCASSDASDSDVPPADKLQEMIDTADQLEASPEFTKNYKSVLTNLKNLPEGMGFNYQKPPTMVWDGCIWHNEGASKEEKEAIRKNLLGAWSSTVLPVEDSTAINQQAKAVISKVPTCKPGSELARLEKSQLKNTKKKD